MEMSTTSSSNLPPLRNLPCWSRVRDLDRVRYPRLLRSDCVVRSSPVRSPKAVAQVRTEAQDTRVASLERDIVFLQQQHRDTLEKLHEEIQELKRANKELQYQLVMQHDHSSKESICSNSHSSKSSSDGSAEQNSQRGFISSEEASPLSASQNLRRPALNQCELLIRQLYQTNNAQHQELLRIRTLLRDMASMNMSSAEVFSLARAFLCDHNTSEVFERFPKLPLKPLPKKQISSGGETVILPSIKHNSSSSMVERQRRAQDEHRTRLRRSLHSQHC